MLMCRRTPGPAVLQSPNAAAPVRAASEPPAVGITSAAINTIPKLAARMTAGFIAGSDQMAVRPRIESCWSNSGGSAGADRVAVEVSRTSGLSIAVTILFTSSRFTRG